MKLTEKLDYLQTHHMAAWLKARREAWDVLSDQYPMFCICGKLCTGLHENYCNRFQNRINSDAVKELAPLLKEGN